MRLLARSFPATLLAAFIACCAVVARSQSADQESDPAALVDAPTIPRMVVDTDGTLHFGFRTVALDC
jgi:hypothetical protein